MKMIRILFTSIFILSISGLQAKILATVGQETISSDDVKRTISLMEESNPAAVGLINEEDALEQLINLKVALIEARSRGLDKTDRAKDAMDAALVNYYVYSSVDTKYRNKQFSKKEISDYYKQNPVIKFQRLAIKFNPSSRNGMEKASSRLSTLRSDIIAKKISFEQAIKLLGDEAYIEISGTFDRIPLPSLPGHEVSDLRTLPKGAISPVMIGDDVVSLIKILNIYPMYSDYAKTINEILKRKEIIQERKKLFVALRKKYSATINVKN
jgi:hypothetical protein